MIEDQKNRNERRRRMRTNISRLLGQFGFGVNNDLLALLICLLAFAATIGVLILVGAL